MGGYAACLVARLFQGLLTFPGSCLCLAPFHATGGRSLPEIPTNSSGLVGRVGGETCFSAVVFY